MAITTNFIFVAILATVLCARNCFYSEAVYPLYSMFPFKFYSPVMRVLINRYKHSDGRPLFRH